MDFKAGNGLNNKNNLDTEKSFLESLEAKYKTTYFWSLFVLLKEEDNSMIFSILGAFVTFFQLLIYPFHANVNPIWQSPSILNVLDYATNVASIDHYLKQVPWEVFLIIFYILLFILLFVKANTIYVSYSFSKKKFSFMWPVYTLWAFFSLFSTILFFPILDIFVSVLTCQAGSDGSYYNVYFPTVQCWKSEHILHAIFAFIAIVLFLETNFVVSLCYFECKSTANVPSARVNARANFLIILYHTVMIISFMFMRGSDYYYILLIFITGGSLLIFFKFHFNSPYYNERIAKLWSCLMSINLWAAIMLCFAKFMEGTLFEGSIVAWLIGVPFIVLIVLTNRDQRVDLLLINVNKFQSGDELQNQIRFILKLISWQSTNKNASILLDGYIEIHKQTCNKEDCPLKQKAVRQANFKQNKLSQGADDIMTDKTNLLIKLLDRMYYYGIKKFPNNTSLRISYAFFLIEKMDLKQNAVHELTTAEQNKPPFDEQFIIFRYRKIIDDELAESKNEGNAGLDAMSEQTFQNHLRQFQANIEKSSMLHMEFWSQLGEDNPDLNKLNELGVKIYHSVNNVEDHWQKLQKISQNVPKAMKLYGKFLTDITNDKERGDEFLEKARNMININSNKRNNAINFSGNEEIGDNSTPTIFVSGENEKIGIITNINFACSAIFGYTKSELINRNVKILMPPIYSKNHDSYIEAYNQTQEMKFIDKERLVFGKHKSYYVFPVFVNIKPINNGQSVQFAGTFRIDKFFKNVAYILTNQSGSIDSISSSCISLLNVDLEQTRKNSSINSYFKDLIDEAAKPSGQNQSPFRSTNGAEVDFVYKDEDDNKEKVNIKLQCYISDIHISSVNGAAGYIFKFEPKASNKALGSRKHRSCTFQFRYNRLKGNIIGEFTDMLVDDLLSDGEMYGTAMDGSHMVSGFADEQRAVKAEAPEIPQIDYGEGIRTMVLRDGKPVEANAEDDEDEKDDQNNPGGLQHGGAGNKNSIELDINGEDVFSAAMFDSTFKTRKQLEDILGNSTTPKTIMRLNIIAHVIMIFVLALTFVDFFVSNTQFNQIKDNVNLIIISYNRVAEIQNIVAKSRDLYLTKMNVYPYDMNQTVANKTSQALTYITGNITFSTDIIQNIQRELQVTSKNLMINEDNIKLTTTNAIKMVVRIGDNKSYDLNEATRQVVTMAINLKDSAASVVSAATQVSQTGLQDSNWYFIIMNCFNDYLTGLFRSSTAYVSDLTTRTNNMGNIFLLFFLIALISIFIGILLLIPSLWSVNKQKQEILGLFLYLNEEGIKVLYGKCEKLMSNLQVGEDDDADDDLDDASVDKAEKGEQELPDGILGKRKKNFKTNWKTNKCFLFMIIGYGLILEAYFIFNFYQNKSILSNMQSLTTEINATTAAQSYFYFTANTQSILFLNETIPVQQRSSNDVVKDNINNMFELDSTIHEEHSINVGIHSDSYKEFYNNLMMLTPCTIMESLNQAPYNAQITNSVCMWFASGTLGQGMALGLARHYENMRNMYSKYLQTYNATDPTKSYYWNTDLQTCQTQVAAAAPGTTNLTQGRLCLMQEPEAREIDNMLFIYIRNLFQKLVNEFQKEINSFLDSNISLRLALMICLIVYLFFCYLFLWLPLIGRFTTDFCRTRSMLTMIPKSMIRNTKEIRVYIKKCMSENSVANY